MSSKNILYISYDGLTDSLGQSQILPYVTGLAKLGLRFTILSFEKRQKYHTDKERIEKQISGLGITWVPLFFTSNPPLLSKLYDLAKMRHTALQLQKQFHFDLVHCRSYVSASAGLLLKRKLGVKLLFDMRGFWADERVDAGLWKLSNPLFRKMYTSYKKKEKIFLQEADAVISLTYAAKAEMESWALSGIAPIHVIPCCVDTDLFNPEKIEKSTLEALRAKARLPEGSHVLGYLGSLGTWYLLSEMLDFYKIWIKHKPESILFFVTAEPPEMIEAMAVQRDIKLERIRIVNASRSEVPYYISMMNIGLFFLKAVYSKKASSPVKQGEIMAMGVPVICNAGVGDSDRIIEKYGSGLLVKSYSDANYEQVINEYEGTSFSSAFIREGCIDYFDLTEGIQQYLSVYRSIIS
jgi:glycosyltransferase involved in cell wall biosynthesis